MSNFAVVNPAGGIVSNVIVGDSLEIVEPIVGPCVEVTEGTGPAGIGWSWDGLVFTAPPVPKPEAEPEA
jgi:hypothetical protein